METTEVKTAIPAKSAAHSGLNTNSVRGRASFCSMILLMIEQRTMLAMIDRTKLIAVMMADSA